MTTLYQTILPDSTPKAVIRESRTTRRGIHPIVPVVVSVLIVVGFVGCGMTVDQIKKMYPQPAPTTIPTEQVQGAKDKVDGASKVIADTGAEIAKQADKIDAKAPVAKPETDKVRVELKKQTQANADLDKASTELTETKIQLEHVGAEREWWISYGKGADTKITDLQKQLDDAKGDAAAKRAASMTLLMVIGGFLTVAGIVVVAVVPGMLGKAGGTALMLSGPALGAYAVLVDQITRWSWVVVVLAGAAGVLGLIYLGYVLYKNRDAFTRTVQSVKGMQDEVFDVPFVMQAGGVTEAQANLIVEAQWRHAFGDAGIARTIQGAKVTGMVRNLLGKMTEVA